MHPHGVDVLDATNDDAVVLAVSNDLELVLLPTQSALVDEDLRDHARRKTAADDVVELFEVVSDSAASATKSECGTDDRWESDLVEEHTRVFEIVDRARVRLRETQPSDDRTKGLAILSAMRRSSELHSARVLPCRGAHMHS